ncbi:Short-chain dehydrogenase/reductase SDR [Lasiodiplodia theobromae]|uniref:Estradiol 17-beta-dehydrogenase 8 n=1 Tax=Lasiodiplodia theobromae TaxID=45133 RepID=A0A5N5DB21_9PEZI|nr:Estradiol 17-beta-dehydrogenase 8 [Lasiodiplodia theobromae]KAF9635076.1 Short-chain dehydrogenase/reductase SDR [Lasiodiplodia theobromae]
MALPTRRLAGKTAIVTGASSGIGRAIALRYASEGAKVVCADLTPKARGAAAGDEEEEADTHALIEQRGGEAAFVEADVGDAGQMERLVEAAVERFGRVDVMVNNAGVSLRTNPPKPLHLTDDSIWDATMRVNAKGVFLGCKHAIAQMLKQEPHESGDRGWIVNISSIMALVGGWRIPAYCASKGAVTALTRQVALEYAEHRIHCNAICPGYVQTPLMREATKHMDSWDKVEKAHPFGGAGYPEDIAKIAVMLASDDASWMTGTNIPVDGGYTAQ